jgi:integrase
MEASKMAIYKRGNMWWYAFWWNGGRIQNSSKIKVGSKKNKKAAEDAEAAFRTALAKGEVGIIERKPGPTLKDFSQRFLDNAAVGRRRAPRASTLEFYAHRLNQLLTFEPLASARLDRITPELIEKYVKTRQPNVGSAYLNRELDTLRRCLHVALDLGLINTVPRITLLQGRHEQDFVLARAQERLYLETVPQPLRDVAVLMLETGLRVGEVCGLEWRDVTLEPVNRARFGFLHVRDGKSRNARRTVPLTERASKMLAARRDAAQSLWVFGSEGHKGPLSRSTVSHQHIVRRRLLEMAEGFVIHGLRHTMLTRLWASGADAFTIKRIVGHSSVTVSEKYIHPTPESMELAFSRFEDMGSKALESGAESPKRVKAATISATIENLQELVACEVP